MTELKITSENFEREVLNSDKPVLIDFWAPWCGPCRMLSPTISEIAEEYKDKVKVGKVNVDDQAVLAMEYKISSIPTLLLFENGEIKNKSLGFIPKDKLLEFINN